MINTPDVTVIRNRRLVSLPDLAERLGISRQALHGRVQRGVIIQPIVSSAGRHWTEEEADTIVKAEKSPNVVPAA